MNITSSYLTALLPEKTTELELSTKASEHALSGLEDGNSRRITSNAPPRLLAVLLYKQFTINFDIAGNRSVIPAPFVLMLFCITLCQ